MEKAQAREWAEAQKIAVSVDLVEAAKKHLKFLFTVERYRFLYEDQTLQRAIYRYNAFWLPLLAKHLENLVSEESLVVPLDCELIWHCHRLNPVRYKFDCEKLFGRILSNDKVISSLQATSKTTTEEIWNKMYPEEPYELDLSKPFSGNVLQESAQNGKFTSYDLVAAVKRQMSFTYQACRPHMLDDLFLQEAEARYKGFLHLIKTNRKMRLKRFCVPTYDIDLMWHTHQLYPNSYCKDMIELSGSVIQLDDSDSDKSEGGKLNNGFTETTKQFEQTFGLRYWKAGAMYKGDIPTPVTQVPYKFNAEDKEFNSVEKCGLPIQFPTEKAVEVLIEFLDIKNLPEENKENLLIAFSKNRPDKVYNTRRWLGISSATKEKMFALFQCEPKGEFLFELMSFSRTSSEVQPNKAMKLLGSCSLSIEELLTSPSQLSTDKWVSVDNVSTLEYSEPVQLHVSLSFSPPMPAPLVFQLGCPRPFENDQVQTHVMDYSGKKVFGLRKRNTVKDATKGNSDLLTKVYCITATGEKHALVENHGNYWSVKGTHGLFKLRNISGKDNSFFELVGYNKMVKVFPGRRLEFEPKQFENKNNEHEFTTVVEFSADYPYAKAISLINLKSGTIKAIDESLILPSIALAFILSDTPKGEEQSELHTKGEDSLGLVKPAGGACGPYKQVQTKNDEAYGTQCIGQCTNCGDTWDEACKLVQTKNGEAYGTQCIGQCTNCGDSWDEACKLVQTKNDEAYGTQCIGQCTNCGDTWDEACKLVQTKNGEAYGTQCIGQCTNCGDSWDEACKLVQTKNDEAYGTQCIGQCTNCGDSWDEACKLVQTKNDEAYGTQCIGQCTNCGDSWDEASKLVQTKNGEAYGSQCIGQCTNCGDSWDEVCKPVKTKNGEVYGSQCIGQCTNCGDSWDDTLDLVKAVDCGRGQGKWAQTKNDEGYGSQCIGQCTNCGDSWDDNSPYRSHGYVGA